MHFQFAVTGPTATAPQPPALQSVPADGLELLRQILEVQKEQLALTRAVALASDAGHRWRSFLARWQAEYPDLAGTCKEVLPQIERAYMELMHDLATRLRDDGDGIDNEFTLGEFLDRYGMKLGQLGTILHLVTPLAEAAAPSPSAQGEANPGESEA